MSHIIHDLIASGDARIVDLPAPTPVRHQVEADRNFGLPKVLVGVTVASYLVFLAILGLAFSNPALAIPMVIMTVLIIAAFGVPAVWTRLKDNPSQAPTLGEFEARGMITHTGRLAPRDAAIQVLILPVLLVLWGLAIAVIAAMVA